MSNPSFLFISVSPDEKKSVRAKELQHARIRGHAASVSFHRRRRAADSVGLLDLKQDTNDVDDKSSSLVAHDIHERNESHDSHLDSRVMAPAVPAPGAFAILPGLRVDPFSTYPQSGGQDVHVIIDYHAQVMAPSHAVLYEIFNITNMYTAAFQELLSHADFMHAAITSVLTIMSRRRQQKGVNNNTSKALNYHMSQAIARLRERLLDRDLVASDITLMTVMLLASATNALGDHDVHSTHTNGIRRLVSIRGGLNALPRNGVVKSTLMQWESFWALQKGQSIFSAERPAYLPVYPSDPCPPLLQKTISNLPSGFETLAKKRKLAIDTIEILRRVQVMETAISTPVKAQQIKQHMFQAQQRQYDDWWSACSCLGAPDDDDGRPNFEKLIVLSTMIFCIDAFNPIGEAQTSVFQNAREYLTENLKRRITGSEDWGSERHALVWASMVTIDAWRSGANGGDSNHKGSHLEHQGKELLREMKDLLGISAEENLFELMRGFFSNMRLEEHCARHVSFCV